MFIEISNLTKRIKKATVLDNINIRFTDSKIYGLKGKNGSGKTMLMRAICGLILPTEGTVNINGEILGKDISFPKSIGILIENPSFVSNYTGFKNLKILAEIQENIDDEAIKEVISLVGLNPDDKKKYKKYSLGMKQRLGIAGAIMENPDIVLLDEPLNALDEKGVNIVRNILLKLRDQGKIIIIACHDKEELEFLSDEIYSIEDGRITGHEIIKNSNVNPEDELIEIVRD